MKEIVQHPIYGEITYTESFLTGKKGLIINGIEAQPVSKKEFMFEEKKATINGSFYSGVNLCIEDETIELSPKPQWYEIILAILPAIFLLTWGNIASLCAIFPVIGGAIGGALGAAGSITSFMLIKKTKSIIVKVLIGFGVFTITILIAFALALAFLQILA